MTRPLVVTYTIGQTPRPDLTEPLAARFPFADVQLVGALDGVERDEIPPPSPHGYPLETRLAQGDRVVVDAHFVGPRLQDAVARWDKDASAHLILCAGSFPRLEAPAPPLGSPGRRTPLVRPFHTAADELSQRWYRRLAVVVPFAEQANPAMDKWAGRAFACRAYVLAERPRHRSLGEWLQGLVRGSRAQALVFDYVGLPAEILHEANAELDLPVFDVGDVALDALERILSEESS